jgi:hypothetical protein
VHYQVIHESVLSSAPKVGGERRQMMDFIRWLGEHPSAQGDYADTDATGRRREVMIVGRHAITFWADHAAKEIKVTNIQIADV